MYDWPTENYSLQKETNFDVPLELWDGLDQHEELTCMFDETTPVKETGDLVNHVVSNVNMNKDSDYAAETSSQVKRRRMLQFDNEAVNMTLHCEENSIFLSSKEREGSLEDAMSNVEQWQSDFSVYRGGDESGSGLDALDLSTEGWLVDCFNDTEMDCNPCNVNLPETSHAESDSSEVSHTTPNPKAAKSKGNPAKAGRNVVFRGRKSSFVQTPMKPSSVVYPFAFIKPCGVEGNVTLKDINQRIRTPPPPKLKHIEEDPPVIYPTSAFSGKPVVGKTKIRTEGGLGSITIMRTKG